jgi:hypothetical protein
VTTVTVILNARIPTNVQGSMFIPSIVSVHPPAQ